MAAAALGQAPREGPLLRVLVKGPDGSVPAAGTLRVLCHPLASFPDLAGRTDLAPLVREIPLEKGRARVPLPAGIAVALAAAGPGWACPPMGPAFAGQVIELQAREPGVLRLSFSLPDPAARALRVRLGTTPPPGTGAGQVVEVLARGPGPLTLPPFPAGPAELLVLAEGLRPWRQEVEVPAGGPPRQLDIDLEPGARLEVALGSPTPATEVALDGERLPWAAPDATGNLVVTGIPADGRAHAVRLGLAGMEPQVVWWRPPTPGSVRRVRLQPRPALRLEALLRRPDGGPAAGWRVAALGNRSTDLGQEPWLEPAQTDAAGRLVVLVPQTGAPAVLLFLDGGGPLGMTLVPDLTAESVLDLGPLEVPAAPPLRGRLVGLPPEVAGLAWVELAPPEGGPGGMEWLRRRLPVSPDGSFLFPGAGRGVYRLRATAPGRAGLEVMIRVGAEDRLWELALPPGRVVSGRVLFPGDQPAPGALLRFHPLAPGGLPVVVVTDQAGSFSAGGIPEGPLRVTAYLEREGVNWSAGLLLAEPPAGPLAITLFREP